MNFQEQLSIAISLAIGALGGLAVGIEREWSSREAGESPRFAGVRTFLLIGLLGAISILLIRYQFVIAGSIILAASALMILIAYALGANQKEMDSTTEFAAILILASGALAGAGKLAIASAINAFVALVLVEKSRIHSLVYRIRSEELSAGFRFAVLALVILPLLPEGPYGPDPGIRPRELWALVLLFSGTSFAAYIARRAAGPEKGYLISGLLGGLISSTLVTLNYSRESREQEHAGAALALGAIAASLTLFFRVAILLTILNRNFGWSILPFLILPVTVGFAVLFFISRRSVKHKAKAEEPKNPLRFFTAIKMVFAFQIALFLMKWVIKQFGTSGFLVTSGLLGLTDVDSLIFSLSKQTALQPYLAAQAMTIGILSNTMLKLVLAAVIGIHKFRILSVLGLGALAIATLLSLLLF